MKRLVAALLLVSAVACGGSTGPGVQRLGESFALRPGEAAVFAEGLRVEFAAVASDSRCPTAVQCVWEGDATVQLALVESTGARTRLELHTSARFDQSGAAGTYRVSLEGLDPYPSQPGSIPASSYLAHLRVDRAP